MAKVTIANRYGVVPNHILNDPNLSFKAKGIYAYIQSKPDDWDFAIPRIAKETKESKDSVRSGLQELEKAGYLLRVKYKDAKGLWEWEYQLYEHPVDNSVDKSVDNDVEKWINRRRKSPSSNNPTTVNMDDKVINNNKTINTKKYIFNKFKKKSDIQKLKDGDIVELRDGTKALRRYGKFVDYHDTNVAIDVGYYPELRGL